MHHQYLLLVLAVLLLAVPAAAVEYDNTLTVSFDEDADSSLAESYANGSTVIIPYGGIAWIGATQYPGGTWDVTVPNLYPTKPSWKEIVQLNFGNVCTGAVLRHLPCPGRLLHERCTENHHAPSQRR